ncbi:MAG: hypothetical protein KDI55_28820, partial [Anaerolineae bacterium]|nr:hypothetical protein [Anaerolineae bacterium]
MHCVEIARWIGLSSFAASGASLAAAETPTSTRCPRIQASICAPQPMSENLISNLLVIGSLTAAALLLFHPKVSANATWRATVTPLASIIGSGFLVLAPLLVRHFGTAAVWVMAGLCAVAYAVGAAIRWNILVLDEPEHRSALAAHRIENLASWVLAFAYVISVCYYLNLFGAFAMSMTPFDGVTEGKVMTTAVLLFIA